MIRITEQHRGSSTNTPIAAWTFSRWPSWFWSSGSSCGITSWNTCSRNDRRRRKTKAPLSFQLRRKRLEETSLCQFKTKKTKVFELILGECRPATNNCLFVSSRGFIWQRKWKCIEPRSWRFQWSNLDGIDWHYLHYFKWQQGQTENASKSRLLG